MQNFTLTQLRMLLRRLPGDMVPLLLGHRGRSGTPLFVAIAMADIGKMRLLLDWGASIELEGSTHGTPLMAACASGRLAAVKLLIARGAKISYVKDGQLFSAFLAANYHPEVRRWLLVGRFMEGPKLLML